MTDFPTIKSNYIYNIYCHFYKFKSGFILKFWDFFPDVYFNCFNCSSLKWLFIIIIDKIYGAGTYGTYHSLFPWGIWLCYIRFWSYISSPINMFPLLEPECFDSFNSVTFYFTKSDLEKVKYQNKNLRDFTETNIIRLFSK